MNSIISTKQKILICAVDLFASKGYTETSVRDIAMAVGIKPASLYNHFSSKEDILAFMVNDYVNNTLFIFENPELPSIIQVNPTAQGILDCLQLKFDYLTDEYYSKVLCVIHHEHHRNEDVQNFVVKGILNIEETVERIFVELKKLNVIRHDADSDFWKKTASSLIYTLPSRIMMGIGQGSTAYTGMDLAGLLHYMFDTVLKLYNTKD
ncbi:MAG: TetR/AcrR family transcriptional regulator [Leptospirales bacterium]|nr:TetR/AcrR family transcriptional regulator [Leptospirales bacterium]